MNSKELNILIVDDEKDIREIIAFYLETEFNATVSEAESGNKGIDTLKVNSNFDYIISDYNMADGNGYKLYQYVKEKKLQIPFIVVTAVSKDQNKDFRDEKIAAYIEKPKLKKIISALEEILADHKNSNKLETEYFKVSRKWIEEFKLRQCDLYIKLNEKKYVKIASKEDSDILEKTRAKKVSHFYLHRDEKDRILKTIVSGFQTPSEPITFQKMQSIVDTNLDLVHTIGAAFGWDDACRNVILGNIELTVRELGKSNELASLLSRLSVDPNSYLASHSNALGIVASGLVQKFEWCSTTTYQKLVSAAMLHDLGLSEAQLSEHRQLLEMTRKTENHKLDKVKCFMQHPIEGASLANTFKGLQSDVDTIILQHHELPNGLGFPKKILNKHFHRLSAIFIVAEAMVDFIHDNPAGDLEGFLRDHEYRQGGGFFTEIFMVLDQNLSTLKKSA